MRGATNALFLLAENDAQIALKWFEVKRFVNN
jgi:hypothetical protein